MLLLCLSLLLAPIGEARIPTVLVMGDSLAAGYGVGKDKAWPALVETLARDAGSPIEVINAGVSGDTSAGGLRRIEWNLKRGADLFLLELGANDGLRGIPVAETRKNLDQILSVVKEHNPDALLVIAGMTLPPNMGRSYISDFEAIFKDLADQHDAHLIPFLLEGVAGKPELNQADGIHPTEEGHRIIAQLVWKHLSSVLKVGVVAR